MGRRYRPVLPGKQVISPPEIKGVRSHPLLSLHLKVESKVVTGLKTHMKTAGR